MRLIPLLAILGLVAACQAPQPPAPKVEKVTQTVLLPIQSNSPDDSATRISQHLADLTQMASTTTEFCDDLGPEMAAYLELVRPDFEAAASAKVAPNLAIEWKARFDTLSVLVARCMRNARGRNFALALTALVDPLLAQVPKPEPTPAPSPEEAPTPEPTPAPGPEEAPTPEPTPAP